jgi:tripeptidyl-peptidase II
MMSIGNSAALEGEVDGDARWLGAMPKAEIQALQFTREHPEYDGRGVIIAIFDTGVDPGAAGLQTTSSGAPKIVDIVDCTGSGDVDTSTVVKADEEGCIVGLYGRRMKLNPAWTNPSGDWRVGAKASFELFPGGLRSRIKEERKKRWDEAQRAAVTAANAALAGLPAAGSGGEVGRKVQEEAEARVKLLGELQDKFEDVGGFSSFFCI